MKNYCISIILGNLDIEFLKEKEEEMLPILKGVDRGCLLFGELYENGAKVSEKMLDYSNEMGIYCTIQNYQEEDFIDNDKSYIMKELEFRIEDVVAELPSKKYITVDKIKQELQKLFNNNLINYNLELTDYDVFLER